MQPFNNRKGLVMIICQYIYIKLKANDVEWLFCVTGHILRIGTFNDPTRDVDSSMCLMVLKVPSGKTNRFEFTRFKED